MTTQPSLAHAEAYLNVHLSRSAVGHFGHTTGPFVTVSRESGSGGSEFAQALAARLEFELPGHAAWTVFDRNLVETMLQSEHLSPRLARFLPEDRVSEIDASIGELVGLHPNLWQLIQRTNELTRQLARTGHVILVGRGGNCATAAIAGGLHVRLVAPPDERARFMAARLGIPPDEAAEFNLRADAARRSYVRAVFETDINRASGYDLIINRATVPLGDTVELVVAVLRSRVAATIA